MSLLEKKRLQWAQERAEMESLHFPLCLPSAYNNSKLADSRSKFASSLEIRTVGPQMIYQDALPHRQRSPSLPPIFKAHTSLESKGKVVEGLVRREPPQDSRGKQTYEDGEGETSGYVSEVAPQTSPEFWQTREKHKKELLSDTDCQCERSNDKTRVHPVTAWHTDRANEYYSEKQVDRALSESEGESRPKWGDKGVTIGRLWEPHEGSLSLPQTKTSKDTPSWLERGLSSIDNIGDTQFLLMDQMSSSSSMESYESKVGSLGERLTHLLGQNVPIESSIRAERESRRLKALELQTAIVQQLEERALKRKEEKDKKLREDMEEEERFRKQKDLENQRLQDERKLIEEKQQREQKRAETLRKALEKAEQQAKLDRENKKIKRLRDRIDSTSLLNSETLSSVSPKKIIGQRPTAYKESQLIQNIYIEQAFSPRKGITSESDGEHRSQNISTETNIIMPSPHPATFTNAMESPPHGDNIKYEAPRGYLQPELVQQNATQSANALIGDSNVSLVGPMAISQDVFSPMHIAHNAGIQMAFLMPQHMYPCMHSVSAQPFNADFQQHRHLFSGNSQTNTDEYNPSRVLTPSKYRNPNSKDVFTQTDAEIIQNIKSAQIENNQFTKDSKSLEMSEESFESTSKGEKSNLMSIKKEKSNLPEEKQKDVENRPKWGANKPPTQYKKQSEKDVFYCQKRKLRTKKRVQEKQYTSQSSDENTSPSPQETTKSYEKLQRNQTNFNKNYWRKLGVRMPDKGSCTSDNVLMEATEISALKYCDRSGIVKVYSNTSSGSFNKLLNDETADSKNISLSQKFTNDKCGNPKMWNRESFNNESEQNTTRKDSKEESVTRFKEKYPQSKQFQEKAKKEHSKYTREGDSSNPIILDQLQSLRDCLKQQQQIWGKYQRTAHTSNNQNTNLPLEPQLLN